MTDTDTNEELNEKLKRYEEALTRISLMYPYTGGVDAKLVFDAAQIAKEALGIH